MCYERERKKKGDLVEGRERGSIGQGERKKKLRHRGESVCTLECTIIERRKGEKASTSRGEKERDSAKGGKKDSMLRREKK